MIPTEHEKGNYAPTESVLKELDPTSYHDLPSDPNQLLSETDHQRLNAELARLADIRQRVEAESRDIAMG